MTKKHLNKKRKLIRYGNRVTTLFAFLIMILYFLVSWLQSENFAEENELSLDDEMCYGKRCTANEHCCPGSVCVDVDGGK